MYFFKERYHTLNRGLLAEAVSIFSDKIQLSEIFIKDISVKDEIKLNDVLKIKVEQVRHSSGNYHNSFYMYFDTFVEDIKMAHYEFELDLTHNKEYYRTWNCTKVEIFHHMPNQFIDLMNDWSSEVVRGFEAERDAIKEKKNLAKKKKHESEEAVLEKYRNSKFVLFSKRK